MMNSLCEPNDENAKLLARFLDGEGRVKQLPAKRSARLAVLLYLADRFETGVEYTEREVNALLTAWHTFDDFFILRRELVDHGLLCRLKDGSRYWKGEEPCL